jgi:prepilin-type N-terminal cleavage/methylation domain-containing protein
MSSRSRAGFTLVELLVALVIFVMVAGSLYKVLNVSQRAARTQTEKAAMQGTLRTGLQIAIAEIEEIWTDQFGVSGPTSAITAMTTTRVTYDAMRGFGTTCIDPAAAGTSITMRESTYSGISDPVAGEKASLFVEGPSQNTQSDDLWRDYDITNVGPGVCTDGQPAYVLTVSGIDITDMLLPGPLPVRIHQAADLGLVAANGRNWLGLGTGTTLTPLAGPLTSTGLLFQYYDGTNTPTTIPANVRSIVLRLYGETDRQGNQGLSGNVTLLNDSMTVRIQLRNGR